MSDFIEYQLAQEEKETAYQRHCASGAYLKNAEIRCRLAEIKSQHEPLSSLLEEKMSERDRLHAIAFWVVVGRFPDKGATK